MSDDQPVSPRELKRELYEAHDTPPEKRWQGTDPPERDAERVEADAAMTLEQRRKISAALRDERDDCPLCEDVDVPKGGLPGHIESEHY